MLRRPRSQWFRIAAAGDTVDARTITEQDIQEMADHFDPEVYGARIWPEHFRGLFPGSIADALGDVVALRTARIKGGELDGTLALEAQVEALPALTKLHETGQKIYHSIEIARNFAGKGHAYLVGLAVTDSPASLATEVAAFAAGGQSVEVGKHYETPIEFNAPSTWSKFADWVQSLGAGDDDSMEDVPKPLMEAFKQSLEQQGKIEALSKRLDALDKDRKDVNDLKKTVENLAKKEDQEALDKEFNALKDQVEKLAAQEIPGQTHTPSSGGDGRIQTNC